MEKEIEIIREHFNKGQSYNVILNMLSSYYDVNVPWNPESTLERIRTEETGWLLFNNITSEGPSYQH